VFGGSEFMELVGHEKPNQVFRVQFLVIALLTVLNIYWVGT